MRIALALKPSLQPVRSTARRRAADVGFEI
jgi:hypothetical protein